MRFLSYEMDCNGKTLKEMIRGKFRNNLMLSSKIVIPYFFSSTNLTFFEVHSSTLYRPTCLLWKKNKKINFPKINFGFP